ncbi:MAG: ParA family protein [Oligoflexia bacterium]|nr:ParA family protein [Oligoflexia bacterium]MBF0365826.1 ParA family protein [Oligoflexia bacterium]
MLESCYTMPLKEFCEIFTLSALEVHHFFQENNVELERIGSLIRITPENFELMLQARSLGKTKLVITSSCVKGGVGKTTLTNCLSAKISTYGHKTLMIDLDQQANLTSSFGVDSSMGVYPTILDAYRGHFQGKKISIQDIVINITSHLAIIPANLEMASLDAEFSGKTENVGKFFKKLLQPIRDQFDIIWFDCPPALTKITSAAQAASDLVVIPINTDKFSLDGLDLTIDSIVTLHKNFDVNPEVKIVINKFDSRQKLGFQILSLVSQGEYKEYLSNTFIPVSKQMDNCIASKSNIWDPHFKGSAQDGLMELAQEIIGIDKWFTETPYLPQPKTTLDHFTGVTHV